MPDLVKPLVFYPDRSGQVSFRYWDNQLGKTGVHAIRCLLLSPRQAPILVLFALPSNALIEFVVRC